MKTCKYCLFLIDRSPVLYSWGYNDLDLIGKPSLHKNKNKKTRRIKQYNYDHESILKGVAQLIRSWICSLVITSLSSTNLRVTGGLHGR
jgi:hypothetical protein